MHVSVRALTQSTAVTLELNKINLCYSIDCCLHDVHKFDCFGTSVAFRNNSLFSSFSYYSF
jgi:hypothetical protein